MGVLIFIIPPYVIEDPSSGFQAMRSMEMGGGFNMVVAPDRADISKNAAEFLTWWSPGQYLVPYFFKLLFHVNTGQASSIATILSNLLALSGFYYFFKKLGFTKNIAAISVLFIICQQIFWIPYTSYNGGETLLFGFEGWFLYGCVALKKNDLKLFLFILLSGWIGFMCKLSFMWIYAAGLMCLWVRLSTTEIKLIEWIKKGFWVAIPAIISLAITYIFFLSKGENPASATGKFKLTIEALGFPLAAPLLTGFSVDDRLNGLLSPDGPPIFTHMQTIIILLLLAILSILLILAIVSYIPNTDYRLFIITFYSISILFFGYSYLRQSVISYESRHFRIIGLLIVPGVIYGVSRSKLYWQAAFLLISIIIAAKSIQFTVNMFSANSHNVIGASGFSLPTIDQPSLDCIRKLDRQNTNAIFAVSSGDVGLEILHNRLIELDDYDENTEHDMTPYKGHAGPVYLLLPADYTGKKLATMCKYFPGYDLKAIPLSKGYVLYTGQ